MPPTDIPTLSSSCPMVGKLRAWEIDRKGKIPQSASRRVQKGLLHPESKGLRKVFCTTQNCFCTGAKCVRLQVTARGFVLPGSNRPFAPSVRRKHFWEFSLSGQFPRPAASQPDAQWIPKTFSPGPREHTHTPWSQFLCDQGGVGREKTKG